MSEQAENWLGYAGRDLQAARRLVEDASLTGLAAFHCQQCIEKAFKAMLGWHNEAIPRIHDLITLHERVGKVAQVTVDEDTLRQIDDVYIDTRYPVTDIPVTQQSPSVPKVRLFLEVTQMIYDEALRQLNATQDGEDGE